MRHLFELSCRMKNSSDDETVFELCDDLGIQACVEENSKKQKLVKCFLSSRSAAQKIETSLITQKRFSHFQIKRLPYHHWANRWKKGLKILRVSKNLVIKPSWTPYQAKNGETLITLDPGMAFGTGHHETTRMCLEWLVKHHSRWKSLCDAGCGSGILSITAYQLGIQKIFAFDIDPEAIRVAGENAELNRTPKRFFRCIGLADLSNLSIRRPFDAVMANLTARDIEKNWNPITSLAKRSASIILAGIEVSQRHWFLGWLSNQEPWYIQEQKKDGDWLGFLLKKSTPSPSLE